MTQQRRDGCVGTCPSGECSFCDTAPLSEKYPNDFWRSVAELAKMRDKIPTERRYLYCESDDDE